MSVYMASRGCDWCGDQFADGERQFAGYLDEPTHQRCLREARRAWRDDRYLELGEPLTREREPFTDWPNGQGI